MMKTVLFHKGVKQRGMSILFGLVLLLQINAVLSLVSQKGSIESSLTAKSSTIMILPLRAPRFI